MRLKDYYYYHWHYLIAILFSIIVFGYLYGFSIVNPLNNNWVLEPGGDRTQHYIGWETFRDSPLSFPVIGKNHNISYPNTTSIAMTDSIPLVAIPLKIIDKVIELPEGFQYIGLYGLISFILTAAVSVRIMFRLTKDKLLSLLSSAFFIISPIMLFRMFAHTALASHWIILYAIYLLITYKDYRDLNWIKKSTKWMLPVVASSMIHPYLNIMVLAMFAGYLFKNLLDNKLIKQFLATGIVVAIAQVASYIVVGLLITGGDGLSDFGFGEFSLNLVGVFNPLNNPIVGRQSLFMKGFSGPTQYQYEGFMYLGLGIIIALLVIFIHNYKSLFSKKNILKSIDTILSPNLPVVLSFAFLTLYALSNKISVLNKEIIYININDKMMVWLSTFRASGRLFWPVYYLILIYVVYYFNRMFKTRKLALASIILVLLIQVIDASPKLYDIHNQFKSKPNHHYETSEQWKKIAEGKKHFVFIDGISTNFELIAPIATNIDATISTANIARGNYKEIDRYAKSKLSDVMNNRLNNDEVYLSQDDKICSDIAHSNSISSMSYTNDIDGFCVITKQY